MDIITEGIRRAGGSQVEVDLTLVTTLGRFPLQLTIIGGNSMGDNEKIALRELETVLGEALEAVRQKLA